MMRNSPKSVGRRASATRSTVFEFISRREFSGGDSERLERDKFFKYLLVIEDAAGLPGSQVVARLYRPGIE